MKLIGDRVVGILESQDIRPEGAAVELRMADGSTCQSRKRYHLNGLVSDRPYSWEAFHIPGLTSALILGMRSIVPRMSYSMVTWWNYPAIESSIMTELSMPGDETRRLAVILQHELSLFDGVPGKTIRLKKNVVPIKQRHYPRNPAMPAIINEEVNAML